MGKFPTKIILASDCNNSRQSLNWDENFGSRKLFLISFFESVKDKKKQKNSKIFQNFFFLFFEKIQDKYHFFIPKWL